MVIIPAWRANAFVLTSSLDRPSVACADFYIPAGPGFAIEDFRNRFAAICRANAGPVLFDLAGVAARKTTWTAAREPDRVIAPHDRPAGHRGPGPLLW